MEAQTPVRDSLREATGALHGEVDGLMGSKAPMSTTEGYVVFLKTMRAALSRFQGPLDASSEAAGIEVRGAKLMAAIEQDLLALGEDVPATGQASAPPTANSQSWGVGYSMEGSSMGARMLLSRVAKTLGPGVPTAYLEASSEGSNSRWPAFIEALEAAGPLVEEAKEGAQSVFRFLVDELTRG